MFHVPTNILISRLGSTLFNSEVPRRVLLQMFELWAILRARAFSVGMRCRTCAAINACLAKESVLAGR